MNEKIFIKQNKSLKTILKPHNQQQQRKNKIVHVHAYSDQNNLQLHIEQQIDKMPWISFLFCDLLLLFKP